MRSTDNCSSILNRWRNTQEDQREPLKNSTFRIEPSVETEIDEMVSKSFCPEDDRSSFIRKAIKQRLKLCRSREPGSERGVQDER